MAREGSEGKASDDAIMKLVEALDERNDHLEEVISAAREVHDEVAALRHDVFARPSRQETDHRRRVAAVWIVLLTYVLLMISDSNVNSCSPGFKASIILDEYAKGRRLTPEKFREMAADKVNPACDIAFPFRLHDRRDSWPTKENVLGFVIVLAAGGTIAAYSRGPRGWRPRSAEE